MKDATQYALAWQTHQVKQFAALYHNNGPRTSKTDKQNNHKNESISDIILFAPEITV